jgi:hypothetical protein
MEGISEKDIEMMAMMVYESVTEDIWPPRSHHLRYRYIDAVESVLEYVSSILAAKAGAMK